MKSLIVSVFHKGFAFRKSWKHWRNWKMSVFCNFGEISFQEHSKRLIFFGWRIFALIVIIAYAMALQPFMTTNKMNFKYGSVEALLENPDFRFTVYGGGSSNALLEVYFLQGGQDHFPKRNGYNSITVHLWPLVGKTKMCLRTIQFFQFSKICLQFSAVCL